MSGFNQVIQDTKEGELDQKAKVRSLKCKMEQQWNRKISLRMENMEEEVAEILSDRRKLCASFWKLGDRLFSV